MWLVHYTFLNIHHAKFYFLVWIRSRDTLVMLRFVFLVMLLGTKKKTKNNNNKKNMYQHDRLKIKDNR